VSLAQKNYVLVPLFAALAERTRLRLLNLMNGREVCVCYFVEILGQSQPKISRHLAYLRRAAIVSARREGKWIHYKIVAPKHAAAARILGEMLSVLSEDKAMQADLARLNKACCAPRKVPALSGAPLPIQIEAVSPAPVERTHLSRLRIRGALGDTDHSPLKNGIVLSRRAPAWHRASLNSSDCVGILKAVNEKGAGPPADVCRRCWRRCVAARDNTRLSAKR
jgi:ArsR family transcriptional regulator